jgi:ubiquinone/menaquinone biosynthesis C-methylase UbiE
MHLSHQQHEIVVDQFTKQAVAFASAAQIRDAEALDLLMSASGAGANDRTLDVACGPGIVVCHFAAVVKSATGIDLTPAMIDQARLLQLEKGLTNVVWRVGDVTSLPYAKQSFSIVTSRYAFHHFEHPAKVLSEMVRVCEIGGKVVLMDVFASQNGEQATNFNRMERLRDPSHVRALSLAELCELFETVELPRPSLALYKMHVRLDHLLKASFPNKGDAEEVARLVRNSLEHDSLGLQTRTENENFLLSYPIALLASEKKRG